VINLASGFARIPFWRPLLRPSCNVDVRGCPICSQTEFRTRTVLSDDLSSTWELSELERRWLDDREGHLCAGCGASRRIRTLLWSLRNLLSGSLDVRTLQINEVPGIESALSAGSLVRTAFPHSRRSAAGSQREQTFADMRHLPFASNTFDLIVHSDTIEHVLEWTRAIDEVYRVLRAGGLHVYSVPVLPWRKSRPRLARDTDGRLRHLLRPSYHGEGDDYLVAWEFGGDFLRQRRPWILGLDYDHQGHNPTVFTIVERKPCEEVFHNL